MHTKYKNCKILYQTDVTGNENREWSREFIANGKTGYKYFPRIVETTNGKLGNGEGYATCSSKSK